MGISNSALPICGLSVAILVRWLVGRFPYSGQATPPMFGDYEAQRHWMEITTNLPIKYWYHNTSDNDLQYWGLDYPPLTAYHMNALGRLSKLLNQSWTELHHSRGIESPEHKMFMRLSVVASDLLIYMSAILYYFHKTKQENLGPTLMKSHRDNAVLYSFMVIMYPAQILVDHGHFQYNCVFMGLTLWAVIFMVKNSQGVAAILFTLALTYKQMSLQYSLPFFWFIASYNLRVKPFWLGLLNIVSIGMIVAMTFTAVLIPWILNVSDLRQIATRVFPFNRGVFEDKVANLWYCGSIFYKFRDIYSTEKLISACTTATLVASLPSGLHLLFRPTIRNFKYALVNVSLAFFLLSFQVHEKTILVPALPILLLIREHNMTVNWFIIISTFSLQPLLERDGQIAPFLVLLTMFTILSLDIFRGSLVFCSDRKLSLRNIFIVLHLLSIIGCFVLIGGAMFIKPPARYPHLHSTINALYSCGHFVSFMLFFNIQQFKQPGKQQLKSDSVFLEKKNK